jgi:hypothetical protein
MKRKPNSKTLFLGGVIGRGWLWSDVDSDFLGVGGGYGGVAAEEVGGDYGEKERDAEMRGEREFLSVFFIYF